MNKYEIDDLKRRLDFRYNGDLGALQHKSNAFCEMLRVLLSAGQITKEQYNELGQQIIERFKTELQYAISHPYDYIQ